MSASANDLVRNATPLFSTTLGASMAQSDTSMTLSSVTGLPTGTGVTLVVDATNASGQSTPTVKEVVTGVVSGSTIANLNRGQDGTTQQAHSTGANVVMWITANLWNDFQTAFLEDHEQLHGYHKSLHDTNGNIWIGQSATDNAINYIELANSATGNGPTSSAVGSDTDIDYNIATKGNGEFKVNGNPFMDGAWKSWTPTYANLTIGNGTVISKYTQIGKTVFVKFMFTLGSTSAVGADPQISFPVTPATFWVNEQLMGTGSVVNQGNDIWPAFVYFYSGNWGLRVPQTNSGNLIVHTASGQNVTPTYPYTFTTNGVLSAQFSYEAA